MITAEQFEAIEQLGDKYQVVLVDPSEIEGAVTLTPAKFCGSCSGDGVDQDSYQRPEIDACSGCEGRGGTPVTYEPITVLSDGSPA